MQTQSIKDPVFNRIRYWKEEPERRKWKLVADTPEAEPEVRKIGGMFLTHNSFEYEPGNNGRPEPIRFGDLPLDFDDKENPARALQDVKSLCLVYLPETYGLDPYAIRYYDSGSKGNHVEIPAELLGAQGGDQFLPLIYKKLVSEWKEALDLKSLDLSLYAMGKGKMFRLPNVKRKNGRYKIPLTLEEIRDLSIDQINELTKAPREIELVEVDLNPIPELAEFFVKHSLLFQNKAELPKDIKPPLTLEPVLPGKRDDTLTRLVGRWIAQGMDFDTVYLTALGWRETLPDAEDFTKKDVKKIFDSITKKEQKKSRLDTISAALGLELQKFRIRKYPDGDTRYQLSLKGIPGDIELSVDELESQSRFRRKLIELARKVIPDIKRVRWFKIVQSLLDQAEIEKVNIDESDLGVIFSIIKNDIEGGEFTNPQDFISHQSVLFKDYIYLEMSALRYALSMKQYTLLARNPKTLGSYLRKLGFEKGVFRIRGKRIGKRWKVLHEKFIKYGDEN